MYLIINDLRASQQATIDKTIQKMGRKNIAGEEWKLISIKIQQRKREGKESEVVFNGKIINPKTVRKELRRHAPAIGDPLDSGIELTTH